MSEQEAVMPANEVRVRRRGTQVLGRLNRWGPEYQATVYDQDRFYVLVLESGGAPLGHLKVDKELVAQWLAGVAQ